MDHILTKEETGLLDLLRASLTEEEHAADAMSAEELQSICRTAEKHSVLPLLQPVLEGTPAASVCLTAAQSCAAQFYHLLILNCRCVRLLEDAGIETVVLKGAGAAWYYPVPEHRRSGDIDLLLARPDQMDEACRILTEDGAVPEEDQHANHHMSLRTPEGIDVELHISIVEDFDSHAVNGHVARAARALSENRILREIMPGAELPVPAEPDQAVSLMLHMLQHFLRAGFGLKLICDWAALWSRMPEGTDLTRYEIFLDECGLRGFSDMLGSVCVRYLGLDPEKACVRELFGDDECREFLRDIFDAGTFGHSSPSRMVMVRGGIFGYIREFHHQMHLNYPSAGKQIVLWPLLWVMTLGRFLRNNRRLRRTSLAQIMGETRRRSRAAEPLHLFEKY